MKDALFQELLESVREGGAILRRERKPSRAFELDKADVQAIRERYGLSQPKFAALMGISVGTLRNWEQGRRRPEGSARVLLRVVSEHPEVVLEAVGQRRQGAAPNRGAAPDRGHKPTRVKRKAAVGRLRGIHP